MSICFGRNTDFNVQLSNIKFALTNSIVTSLKIATFGGIALFIISILSLFFFDFEGSGYIVFSILFFSFIICGTYVAIVFCLFEDKGGLTEKRTKADKYILTCSSFDEFSCRLSTILENNGYAQIINEGLEFFNLIIYASEITRGTLKLLLMVNTNEATDEVLQASSDRYIERIENYYGKSFNQIASKISITTFVCVNRVTPAFRRIVDYPAEQDFGISRLVAGVSFGGKGVYIAKPKNIFAGLKYQALYNSFFKMFSGLFKKAND